MILINAFSEVTVIAYLSVMQNKQEQLDEVELIQAMSKEGEFDWEDDLETGIISGTMTISVQLDHPVLVKLIRKEKVVEEKLVADATPECKTTPIDTPPTTLSRSQIVPKEQSAKVEHLPPFDIHFQLPPLYPSVKMPDYSITCKWLNFTQLTLLCKCLDTVWSEQAGGVVLYNWQQFLSNSCLSSLGIDTSSEINLELEDPSSPHIEWDTRAIQDIVHPALIVPLLVEFDKNKKSYLFDQSFFDCQVCFLVKQGSKCVQISDCNHVYCRECLSLFIKTKIGDGDVTKIECPSCDSVIQPPLIKDLISTEDFDRFDKLLLQRTLEGMSDIVYCPRLSCGCATVKETDSNMAQCPRCSFCFCVLCRQTWHGIMPCKLLPGDLKILHETWENIDEAERNHLALMYGGRKKLEHAFQELESNKWVQHNAKGCPSCFAKIQKSEGCNKMTCTQCMKYFCWLCDALLPKNDPYSHFRVGAVNRKSSCAGKLFEGIMHYNADW